MTTPWFNYFISEARSAIASRDTYPLQQAFLAGYRSAYITPEMTEQCLAVLLQPYEGSTNLLDALCSGDISCEFIEWAYLYTPLFEGSDVRRSWYDIIKDRDREDQCEYDRIPHEGEDLWSFLFGFSHDQYHYPFSYLFKTRSEILEMWVATQNDRRLTVFIRFFVLLDALNPRIISRRAKGLSTYDIFRRWDFNDFYYQTQEWPSIDLPDDTQGRTPEELLALYASQVDLSFITNYA